MSTESKRERLPVDFINIDAKITKRAAPAKAESLPFALQVTVIVLGMTGLVFLLSTVYRLATGH